MGIQHRESSYLRAYNAPLYICRECSTDQPFLVRNKPNFRNAEINAKHLSTKDYENLRLYKSQKTNPKQSQFYPVRVSFSLMGQTQFPFRKFFLAFTFSVLANLHEPNEVVPLDFELLSS